VHGGQTSGKLELLAREMGARAYASGAEGNTFAACLRDFDEILNRLSAE